MPEGNREFKYNIWNTRIHERELIPMDKAPERKEECSRGPEKE